MPGQGLQAPDHLPGGRGGLHRLPALPPQMPGAGHRRGQKKAHQIDQDKVH